MSKLTSLISLIHALTKSEKKTVSSVFDLENNTADYVVLFKLINSNGQTSEQKIKADFTKLRPSSAFNTAISYLFDNLLQILNRLRITRDNYSYLLNQLMNAKVLYEKSIYQECFQLITKVQNEAIKYEDFDILLLAQKMEMDYLLCLDFPNLSEKELLNKQYQINETLKQIRKINEHASLYELLKHRILYKGAVRSSKQKQEMNDLVVSEMSIVASSGSQSFEIQKNHKLFQSTYLMNVSDYKSALNSYYELNNLFEQNMHLLSEPPVYYLNTIEGVLSSLRKTRNFEGMQYFINKLNKLNTTSTNFKYQIESVVFLYKLLPLIDTGNLSEASRLIEFNKDGLFTKINLLNSEKQIQLWLYSTIVHLLTGEYKKARKIITHLSSNEQRIFSLPLFRTVRLIELMVLYEQKEFDYMDARIRSVRREINKHEQAYQLEQIILKFIKKLPAELPKEKRLLFWEQLKPHLDEIQNNKFEVQLLHVFNFIVWMKSKIFNISFTQALQPLNT